MQIEINQPTEARLYAMSAKLRLPVEVIVARILEIASDPEDLTHEQLIDALTPAPTAGKNR